MKYKKNFYQIKNSEKIFDEIKKERDIIGYYSLPYQDITEIKFFCRKGYSNKCCCCWYRW